MVTLKLCRCAVLLLPQAFALERAEPPLHEGVVPPSDPFCLGSALQALPFPKFMVEEQPVLYEGLPGAGGDLLGTHGAKGPPGDDVAAELIDDGYQGRCAFPLSGHR